MARLELSQMLFSTNWNIVKVINEIKMEKTEPENGT